MLTSQIVIAYALMSGTPLPHTIHPACPTCPATVKAFPHPVLEGDFQFAVSPTIEMPRVSVTVLPIDPCIAKRCRAEKHRTTGDMFPSCTLSPAFHGNYFFRAYNISTIGRQQAIVQGWGEDPRMPYTSRLFEMLYANQYLSPVFCPSEPGISSGPELSADPHSNSTTSPPHLTTPLIPQSYEDPFSRNSVAPSSHFSSVR